MRLKVAAGHDHISLNEYCKRALDDFVRPRAKEARHPSHELHSSDIDGEVFRWRSAACHAVEGSIEGLVLFGSVARGNPREESDIDLLIVVPESVRLRRKLYVAWDNFSLDSRVNPHFVQLPPSRSIAGSLWFEIALDGIVLYEDDLTISKFLGSIRHDIVDGVIQRKEAHGHAYWIKSNPLKRDSDIPVNRAVGSSRV